MHRIPPVYHTHATEYLVCGGTLYMRAMVDGQACAIVTCVITINGVHLPLSLSSLLVDKRR